MTKTDSAIKNSLIAVALFVVSFTYYYILSAKIWTWLYVSGDSGDWLQFTNWWITPQPFGSPFFIVLIRVLGTLPVENIYHLLNTTLSVLPGAVTVVLAYFVGLELSKSHILGITASLIVLGMSIVLTQATVFEQYMLVTMFASAAYLAYIKGKLAWAIVFLGVGLANHIIMLPIAVVWLLVEWKQRQRIFRLLPLYIVTGVLPYTLILWLLVSDVPNLMVGDLSWTTLNTYLNNVSVMGQLPIREVPRRIAEVGAILLGSLGLSLYPLIVGLQKPWDNKAKSTVLAIVLFLWVWFSCLFLTPYKYLLVTTVMIAGYAAYGLTKLPHWHRYAVAVGAIALIVLNAVYLDADKLSQADPQATNLYNALLELPDGSIVLTPRGGAFGFTLFYSVSGGKNLVPVNIIVSNDHLDWLNEHYDVEGGTSMEIARNALDNGRGVYYVSPVNPLGWGLIFDTVETETYGLSKVVAVKAMSWDEVKR